MQSAKKGLITPLIRRFKKFLKEYQDLAEKSAEDLSDMDSIMEIIKEL